MQVNTGNTTTMPHASQWWVGNSDYRIAFDYQVLDNDRVVLHAVYGNAVRKCSEDVFKGAVDCDEALEAAQKLVARSMTLLKGHSPDEELDLYADTDLGIYACSDLDTLRGEDFLASLAKGLATNMPEH